MIKDEAFLDLEKSLSDLLLPKWTKIQNRIQGQIAKALREDDLSKVEKILDTINPELFYKNKIKRINLLLKTGMYFGASRVIGTANGLLIPSNKKDMELVGIATEQFKLQMFGIVTTMRKRYMSLAARLQKQLQQEKYDVEVFKANSGEVIQKASPINIGKVLSTQGANVGRNMVKVATSLQMSRMAAYGFSAEATARGVTTYRINEQLDSRTCKICQTMHNKTFEVADAYRKLDALIRVKDPDDLKLLAPFPKQDAKSIADIRTLTTQQLQERGYDTPPFHPSCRGLLAVAKKQVAGTQTEIVEAVSPHTVPLRPEELVFFDDRLQTFAVDLDDLPDTTGNDNMVSDGFSVREAHTLTDYTRNGFRDVNAYVRGATMDANQTHYYGQYERVLNNALGKMDKYTGSVIREIDSDKPPEFWEEIFHKGAVLKREDNGFLSTSYEKSGFQSTEGNVLDAIPSDGESLLHIEIKSKTGVKIGRYAYFLDDEKEVLFPTTAEFRVTSVMTNNNGSFHVVMEEL